MADKERLSELSERLSELSERLSELSERLGEPGERLSEPGEPLGEPGEPLGEPGEPLGEPGERLSEPGERLSEPGERLGKRSECRSETAERPDEPGQTMTEAGARAICASSDLADGGDGVRFGIERNAETVPAFAIRHGGRVYAYLNRCAHIAMELDWKPGKFFDADGEYLICSTHGALYAPESGACRGGPCRGAALAGLNVFEADGNVYLEKD